MKYRVALAGGLLLLAAPATVQAADIAPNAPVIEIIPRMVDWSGFYAGVYGGAGAGYAYTTGFEDAGRDIEGGLAGLQAGASIQFDGIVMGIEGDVAWTNVAVETHDELSDLSLTANWLASLRGRLGYAFDSILLYGTAGLASGEFTYAIDYFSEPVAHDITHTHVGWVAGLGVEAMLADDISVKAEYLHREFEPETYLAYEPENLAARIDTFTVGANFHF